jgi:hypothetical protein
MRTPFLVARPWGLVLYGGLTPSSSPLLSPLQQLSSSIQTHGSYTSKVAGLTVTHAFYRQIMNGVEVAGCEITVDVMGSRVISYTGSKSFTVVVCPASLMNRSLVALMQRFVTL